MLPPTSQEEVAKKIEELKEKAQTLLSGQTPFHWELEYPEVFIKENGGFNAFIGNPPFLSGARISSNFGDTYLAMLKILNPNAGGPVDLCSYFFQLNSRFDF